MRVAATPDAAPTSNPQRLLLAVTERQPNGGVSTAVRLVDLAGTTVASTTGSLQTDAIGAAGGRLVFVDGRQVRALAPEGTVTELGQLPAPYLQLWGPIVLSPDGSAWAWASVTSSASGSDSTVYIGSGPVLRSTPEDGHRVLRLVVWNASGLVFEHAVTGLGGNYHFEFTTGPAELYDPVSGARRSLTDAGCYFAAMAEDGTIACRVATPTFAATRTLRIIHPDGLKIEVPLPYPTFNEAGDISFRPGVAARELAIGGLVGGGDGAPDEYQTDLVDVATGSIHAFAPGLRPGGGAWSSLPDGSLLCYRPAGAAGGSPGVYVVAPDGSARPVTSSGIPVGVISSPSSG